MRVENHQKLSPKLPNYRMYLNSIWKFPKKKLKKRVGKPPKIPVFRFCEIRTEYFAK